MGAHHLGRCLHDHRRRDARRDRGGWPRGHREGGHPRDRNRGTHREVLRDDRRPRDGSARVVQRLLDRPARDVRQVLPGLLGRRLVQVGTHPHLAHEPRLHPHPPLPLHARSPIPRRRSRLHLPRPQRITHARRLPRPRPIGQRRPLRPRNGPSHPRRRTRGQDLHPRADRPPVPRAHRQQPVPTPDRPRRRRPRRPALPLGPHHRRPHESRPRQPPPPRTRDRPRRHLQRHTPRRHQGRGRTRPRTPTSHARRAVHPRDPTGHHQHPPRPRAHHRPQSRHQEDQHHVGLELLQVLPRRPNRTNHVPPPRRHRQLGQVRHRHPLLDRRRHRRPGNAHGEAEPRRGGHRADPHHARHDGRRNACRRPVAHIEGARGQGDADPHPPGLGGVRQDRRRERPVRASRVDAVGRGVLVVLAGRLQGAVEREGLGRQHTPPQLRRVLRRGPRCPGGGRVSTDRAPTRRRRC